ncbi:MAG: hypothetical protein LBR94_00845 [Desulfovibrio sp.]|jgi:hypothetical protein|nr:hypothetical protein [Desulfovibrio sp.]
MIYWTANNNSGFLNGYRCAATMLAAVRDARAYIRGELFGEGKAYFFDGQPTEYDEPIRTDERSIFTGYRWRTV